MPVKGRIDPAQLQKALELVKDMMSTRNQADFSEIAESIIRKFGGAEGIANHLSLLYQTARGWKQQKDIIDLVVKIASRKAEMNGGSLDALDRAVPLLSDDDLNHAAISIMTMAMERKGLLDVSGAPSSKVAIEDE